MAIKKNAVTKYILTKKLSTKTMKKQQGVVLVVALVFLVALTGVAAALMQNTTSDMKMTGATNEKVIATQDAISTIDEIIDNQINIRPADNESNLFTQSIKELTGYDNGDLLPALTAGVTRKTVATSSPTTAAIENDNYEAVHCPRSRDGTSIGIIKCNIFQVQVTRPYGRGDTSDIFVNADIAQQLLSKNN